MSEVEVKEGRDGSLRDGTPVAEPMENRSVRLSEQGTIPLFAIDGIHLRVHVVFPAIIIVLGIQAYADGVWQHALYLPALLLALAVHEVGHALAARWLGQTSCRVILHPLLSQPSAGRTLRHPEKEMLTALAGPLASALVFLGVSAALYASGHLTKADFFPTALFSGTLVTRFFAFNLYLCVINLLPVFPLDGGRALRSALAIKWGDLRATQVTGSISLLWAFLFGIVGLHTGNFFALLFALLLVSGVIREFYESPVLVARTSELKTGDILERNSVTLAPGMTVGEVAKAALARPQSQYPVVLGQGILGVVARQQILRANHAAYISGVMARQFFCVKENEPATLLLQRGLPTYARPVVITSTGTSQGDFVGILCAESVHARLMSESTRLSRNSPATDARAASCVACASTSGSDGEGGAK